MSGKALLWNSRVRPQRICLRPRSYWRISSWTSAKPRSSSTRRPMWSSRSEWHHILHTNTSDTQESERWAVTLCLCVVSVVWVTCTSAGPNTAPPTGICTDSFTKSTCRPASTGADCYLTNRWQMKWKRLWQVFNSLKSQEKLLTFLKEHLLLIFFRKTSVICCFKAGVQSKSVKKLLINNK